MRFTKETKIYNTFLISVSLTIALCLSGVFLGMSIRTRNILNDELLTRARTDYNNIVITREWNAHYGGVYVEKKNGVQSNPYLKNPDIRTVDGRTFTNKNPSLMTKEVSEISQTLKYFYHITSLNPLNPNNKPDRFEEEALKKFEAGEKEVYVEESVYGFRHFRYMAPLLVKQECLQCHADQGYKIGDVRGGISVSFDIEEFHKKLTTNSILIVLFGLTTTVLTLSLVWIYTTKLIKKISLAREQIEEMAVTDELTKVSNRRDVISRFKEEFDRSRRLQKHLCCIMLDIDHFKHVNDTYGHQTGDEALIQAAAAIAEELRIYDLLGRFGGEEFLIVLPETSLDDALLLAERLRVRIQKLLIPTGDRRTFTITASLGVTSLHPSDTSVDDLIKRSDQNLYQAKESGRNRVW